VRADAIGIFWQDLPRVRGERTARVMPPIPDTGWPVPTDLPNLSRATALAVDVETYDPELLTNGPGWARDSGHIVGIAVGTPDGGRWYFPMRHTVRPDDNLDPDKVLAWARDYLTGPQPKIGANITYDVGWLRQEGVHMGGIFYDVQFAEALLAESRKVALDDLGERYLGIGKESSELYDWCASFYGGPNTERQRKNIHRAPPTLVGPYAQSDVDLPFRVLEKQWPELEKYGLLELFELECKLIPLMIEMRFAGVRVDIDKTEQIRDGLTNDLKGIDKRLKELAGFSVNTNASDSLRKAFDVFGLRYPLTEKGAPSFRKAFLQSVDHELARLVLQKKEREKLRGTFIEGYILNSHKNGRLYGQFHQLRGTGGGTRSGRFSSSTPNLQNIPIRSELGNKVRECFVPDEGHRRWIKADYSQIEYRALAHYAVGPGADNVRATYNAEPDTDFHNIVKNIIKEVTGRDMERSLVKNINFGAAYGMGETGLARYLKLDVSKAKSLFKEIHRAAPFLKATMEASMREAETMGYITTISGRRSYFDTWVPSSWTEEAKPLPFEQAVRLYPNPRRAYVHKALNRRLQGSAADLIKYAMLQCYENGLFKEVGYPRLTVHDELDFSDPGGKDEVFKDIYHVMENALKFNVPIRVGLDIGPSWGEVVEDGH